MNDLPRQKLREIIQQYGREVVEDPKRCRALLLDLCSENRREVSVLCSALKERVPAELLASKDHTPVPLVLSRLTQRLVDDLALDKDAARWAVETWAVALGVAAQAEANSQAAPSRQRGKSAAGPPSTALPPSASTVSSGPTVPPQSPPLVNSEPGGPAGSSALLARDKEPKPSGSEPLFTRPSASPPASPTSTAPVAPQPPSPVASTSSTSREMLKRLQHILLPKSSTVPAQPAPFKSPAASSTLTLSLAPGVTLELVRVPAGDFLMGSDKWTDQQALEDELPQHTLYLPEFLIGKYPVTNAQYAAFVTATLHKMPKHWKNGQMPSGKGNHPVVNVSWDDANAFCKWASQHVRQVVALPSEAEWEKVARGTDGRIWPWGNEPPDYTRCNFNSNVADTTPVGQYSPQGDSPSGCADMAGNVWEWCQSKHKPYPYQADDGREQVDDRGAFRVFRGGSWGDSQDRMRAAYRSSFIGPAYQDDDLGFRLVVRPSSQ